MVEADDSWFSFKIAETDGEAEGVDLPKLTRLLEHLSAAFYTIARSRIGADLSRRGPRTAAEETLAAVRLVRIVPGSTTIEFAPPDVAVQNSLIPQTDVLTADTIVGEFIEEVRDIDKGKEVASGRWEVRRRVREVIEDAAQIGARGELRYRSRVSSLNDRTMSLLSFRTRDIPTSKQPKTASRNRRLVGHAYMVDVEPGKQRMRLKMPDGRDITLEVDEELVARIAEALDQVVALQVEEQLDGGAVTSRTVRGLALLPSSGPGSDQPPTSIEDLLKEQGLPRQRPDYASLAGEIWRDEGEILEVAEHVASMRKVEEG